MSTATVTSAAPGISGGSTVRQTLAMSKRSVLALARQPALVVPSMIFPLFFAALGASSFSRATTLPGFPRVDSFLDFALASTVLQGVMFGSVTSGTALATDIETGFFDRLLASPTSRLSILVGRLAGAAAYGATQAAFFIALLAVFGVRIKSGPVGIVGIVVAGALIAVGIGGFMCAMALRTGSSEAVQGSFPLVFVLLFFSSAFFPRQTMRGLNKVVANLNPISYIVEGLRGLTISAFSAGRLAEAVLIPLAVCALSLAVAVRSLLKRVAQA